MQMTIQPIRAENETKSPERASTPILEDSVLHTTLQLSPANTSQSYGRIRKKLIRNRAEISSGQNSPGIQLENMTAGQEEEFRQEPKENPDVIIVTDGNGNTNQIKIVQIEDNNKQK